MAGDEKLVEMLDQVLDLSELITADMNQALTRRDLTVPRAQVLWVLLEQGAVTVDGLGEALGVAPEAVLVLVESLESNGYVTCVRERGTTTVTITDKGAAIDAEMDADQHVLARFLFADMSTRQVKSWSNAMAGVLQRLRDRHDEGTDG